MAEYCRLMEFLNYGELCLGKKGCAHKLAKLHDVCEHSSTVIHPVQFIEALKRLKRTIKQSISELEIGMNKKILEFSVGSASVNSQPGVSFSSMKPVSWSVDRCLSKQWRQCKEKQYDGLIVIGCIDTFLIPTEIKKTHTQSLMNQHVYAEGLCQALVQYFMFYKPDRRFMNTNNFSETQNALDKGSIIFVTYKFEKDAATDNEENTQEIEESIDDRTDMQKVLQEQFKINREMSRRLEMLEARVDPINKIAELSPKPSKVNITTDRITTEEDKVTERKAEKRISNQLTVDNFDHQKRSRRQYSDENSLQSEDTNDHLSHYSAEGNLRPNIHTLELDCSSEEDAVMFLESTSSDNQKEESVNTMQVRPQSLLQSPYHSPIPVKASFTGPKAMHVFPPMPRYTNETAHRASRKIGPRFTTDEKLIILSCYMNQVPRGDWLGILDSVKLQCGHLSRELQEYYQTSDRISLKRRIQDYVLGVLNDKRGRNERCPEVRDLIDQIRASSDDSYTVTVPTIPQGDMQMFDNNGRSGYLSESGVESSDYSVVCKIEDDS